MAHLNLHQLQKSFGDLTVVDNISLSVEDGEFMVLVGPSGCGKSTLLRLIAGLEELDQGRIELDGKCVDRLDPGARDIAMVFQNYALYPHMTVAGNIEFPLKMARMPRAEIAPLVLRAAEQLGIEALLKRKPGQLSGGQQQRVALARALVRRPRLFLFDEPLSNVDAKLRSEMRAELAQLHAKLGVTVLHVTHDQVEAMTLGTRIVVLNQGRIQQDGTPLEVYQKPANRFVAGFLGAPPMNLLDGSEHTIGFRPHEIVLEGAERLAVDLVEPLGQETLVHGIVEAGSGQLPSGRAVLALPPQSEVKVGDVCSFAVPAENLHLFDLKTGQRLES